MNGAARVSKCSTEFMDAHVSIGIAKLPLCKHSQAAPRSSPAPRLLLVLLLLAQVLFLAIVRLGHGGLSWPSNPDDGLPSSSSPPGSSMHLMPSTSHKPLLSSFSSSDGEKEKSTFSDQTLTSTDSQRDRELGIENTVYTSETSSYSSVKHPNADVERATKENHRGPSLNHAAAMSTSVDEVKKEHSLIAEKVLGGKETGAVEKAQHHEHNVETYSVPAQIKEVSLSSECRYGYVYVYDLPPMYNQEIIANCTALNVYIDMCKDLLNGGLGPSLGDESPLGQEHSWFKSDQFTTEIMFHKRMLEHPCLTDKQEKASTFYVPYYAGLDVGRYLWEGFSADVRDEVSNHLLEWLAQQPAWKKYGGWGHFLMVGRITWDFRRSKDEDWGSGFFYHHLMQNVTRLLIERNPWDYMEMAVPYPTNFHPQSDADLVAWQNHVRERKRTVLFSFAGATRPAFSDDFRTVLLNQCLEAQSCCSLDCSNQSCGSNQRTLELFMDSKFCLQPRGDSFTRRSTFDCLLAGSIPVFFWHRTAYMQYKWHLHDDADSYSVFISKETMRNGTKIEDVLNAYAPEKVKAMQEVVIGLIPRIVYAVSGSSLREHMDAFDVTIEGIMKRFMEELHLSPQR